MYAEVSELRVEGVGLAAGDARLRLLLDEAAHTIDRVTRQFFEPRQAKLRLDGRGTPTIELPVPPIRLDALHVDYEGRQPFPFIAGPDPVSWTALISRFSSSSSS
jgi:hypothetical protein